MNTRRSPYHQKRQGVKPSLSSKFPKLVPLVGFVAAIVLIIIGVLVYILNTINIIYGPWAPIIGIIFAGVGLIIAFYALFIEWTRKGER